MSNINLQNIDCLLGLKQLADNSIDCVITDPPYKICAGGVTKKVGKKEMTGCLNKRYATDLSPVSKRWDKQGTDYIAAVRSGKMFDHNDIKFSEWIPEVYRVIKPNTHCYIMINARNMYELMTECFKVGFKQQNILNWEKNNATPNHYYMQQYEYILMLRKGGARTINYEGTSNRLAFNNITGNKLHPTQKPVNLMEVMVINSTNKGDTILDPFAGVGATAIACQLHDRNFIGYEIDKQFYDIAINRINNSKQIQLINFDL